MLASLQATLPSGLPYEIIFVDDGSTDGTREWLATLTDPAIRVVLNEKNLGYAAANNRGAALARGEFLALLNNDLVLTPGWLEPMLKVHAGLGTRAGLMGNVQLNASTGQIDHSGIIIDLHCKPEHDRAMPWTCRFRTTRRVAAVTGACVLIRSDLWWQLGGFDEGFINGGEDIDLCLRARATGRINAVALRSIVHHHISASPGRKLRGEENSFKLTLKWHDELVQLATPGWCRHLLKKQWTTLRNPIGYWQGCLALAYVLCLRRVVPPAVLARVRNASEIELARWEKMFNLSAGRTD